MNLRSTILRPAPRPPPPPSGRGGAPRRPGRRAGFTLVEIMIASAVGLSVVAATLSLYLFLSNQGHSLRSQVMFNGQARVLQTTFADLVEANYCLLVDSDNLGVTLYSNEAALSDGAYEADTQVSWIGYEEGDTVRQSRIVHRPNGRDGEPARTLCEWVGPADDGEPMFRLVTGLSVALSCHIGDPPVGSPEPDTTGPGRQGMNVVVIGSCHNLQRKY